MDAAARPGPGLRRRGRRHDLGFGAARGSDETQLLPDGTLQRTRTEGQGTAGRLTVSLGAVAAATFEAPRTIACGAEASSLSGLPFPVPPGQLFGTFVSGATRYAYAGALRGPIGLVALGASTAPYRYAVAPTGDAVAFTRVGDGLEARVLLRAPGSVQDGIPAPLGCDAPARPFTLSVIATSDGNLEVTGARARSGGCASTLVAQVGGGLPGGVRGFRVEAGATRTIVVRLSAADRARVRRGASVRVTAFGPDGRVVARAGR